MLLEVVDNKTTDGDTDVRVSLSEISLVRYVHVCNLGLESLREDFKLFGVNELDLARKILLSFPQQTLTGQVQVHLQELFQLTVSDSSFGTFDFLRREFPELIGDLLHHVFGSLQSCDNDGDVPVSWATGGLPRRASSHKKGIASKPLLQLASNEGKLRSRQVEIRAS